MSGMVALKKVELKEHHLRPGRTRHSISDGKSNMSFPQFVSLEIATYPGDSGYYLLHLCANGQVADTHHATIEEAFHQADYEFGVKPEEWA